MAVSLVVCHRKIWFMIGLVALFSVPITKTSVIKMGATGASRKGVLTLASSQTSVVGNSARCNITSYITRTLASSRLCAVRYVAL